MIHNILPGYNFSYGLYLEVS